ncbi:MAG TPA: PilZ domain-containing protein [Blastocatellia bacterium]|nr:PilZ domain-containing protein [Blastocatellia bacterium]
MINSRDSSRRGSGSLKERGSRELGSTGNTGKLISSYYLEVDYLLERVTNSRNHYQVLGLDHSARPEDIVRAYHQAVKLLHHPSSKVRAVLPEDMRERIDQTFERASEAFLVLTDGNQRIEYDRSLGGRRSSRLTGIPEFHEVSSSGEPLISKVERTPERVTIVDNAAPVSVLPADDAKLNRRRSDRIKLALPVMLVGYDRTAGKWKEVAKTLDVSRGGVSLLMNKPLPFGLVILLRLPMPSKLRCHGHAEPGYNVYGIVRRVEYPVDGARIIGIEFGGAQPPPGYLDRPWAPFRSRPWTGRDRRREPRHQRSEPVVVEYLDAAMHVMSQSQALTEDVSESGLRILVKAAPAQFEMVKVSNAGNTFKSLAGLRNRFVDDDGRERLCLKLIRNTWPL